MHARVVFFLCLAVVAATCTSRPDQREYTLQGQVLAVTPNRHQATINHEEVKGFMAAMTMPYSVRDPKQLEGIAPSSSCWRTTRISPT
jgi:Cu/Ag efflux protein CusF